MRKRLLQVLLQDEADRLRLWLNPLLDPKRGAVPSDSHDAEVSGCPRSPAPVTCDPD